MDKSKVKTAINNLRKYDVAGRIMETDDGMDAPSPCSWCNRKGSEVNCRVWKDKDEKMCAYCRRMGKTGCGAKTAPVEEEQTMPLAIKRRFAEIERHFAELQSRLEKAEGVISEQGEQLKEKDAKIAKLAHEFGAIGRDFEVVWGHLWPSSKQPYSTFL